MHNATWTALSSPILVTSGSDASNREMGEGGRGRGEEEGRGSGEEGRGGKKRGGEEEGRGGGGEGRGGEGKEDHDMSPTFQSITASQDVRLALDCEAQGHCVG